MYSIGTLAKRSGVKVPTIRYYEQQGLIAPPGRTAGNQRRYDHDALETLSFVRHARDLGLPLDAIRDLIRLSRHPYQPCAQADKIAQDHLLAIRSKIQRLRRLEAELDRMAKGCAHGTVEECYVLQSLSDHEQCTDDH